MSIMDPTMAEAAPQQAAEREWTVEDVLQATIPAAGNGPTVLQAPLQAPARIAGQDQGVGIAERPHVLAPERVAAPTAPPEAAPVAAPPAVAALPLPTLRRVSGRYRSSGSIQIELRVDYDGTRPMRLISGDFYTVSGATMSYFGSFIVEAATVVSSSRTALVLEGQGTFTWTAGFPWVRVTIPRASLLLPAPSATVQFMTTAGAQGASYVCPFASPSFRTVQIEEDAVAGVTPFTSYDTGLLPSGGPPRILTVAKAYEEAGIELQTAGVTNIVPVADIGASWSDAELHAAMQTHFSLWLEQPQWKVWLFSALLHDIGPNLLGIMFDQRGQQRQGCAVFHQSLAGTTPDRLREQLYTATHELGHCFNLFHSFHKQHMTPPRPNRLSALSWMNYPGRYQPALGAPGGAAAFWSTFPFQFDDLELIHLRHAFRNDLIPGGQPFGTGAALENPDLFSDPVIDTSGIRFQLRLPKSFASRQLGASRDSFLFGEPVVVELKLEVVTADAKQVNPAIHPNFGFLELVIQRPGGAVVRFEPFITHCLDEQEVTLDRQRPALYDSAYIGYGKGGFYFDQPGRYRVRAVYHAKDGSRVLSNVLTFRVRGPVERRDEEVGELFLGDEQGALLALLGSDSGFLQAGNDAFQQVLERHGDHPMAIYARMIKGINAGRRFKTLTTRQTIEVREPRYEEAVSLLGAVADKPEALDEISYNMAVRQLAHVQMASGANKDAQATANRLVSHFRGKDLPEYIVNRIDHQAKTYCSRVPNPGDVTLPDLLPESKSVR
jgi:hypothetical protein